MAKFIEAVLILSGMIIGAGMFGIPFSFVRAGFWLGTLELLVLSGVILVFHLLYGEIVLRTTELHRLPGYVKIYLGSGASYIARSSAVFGILGTLLIYLIIGSIFLSSILRYEGFNFEESYLALSLALVGAAITVFSLRREAFINGLLTFFLIIFIIFLCVYLFPKVNIGNLSGFNFTEALFPYGVLLFALSGGTVVPDLITLLGRERKKVRLAISAGTLIPALLYFFFAFTVVGVVGNGVSEEAVVSLGLVDGEKIVFWGSVVGLLAVFTSFIVLEKSFQALLVLDLGWSKTLSWLAVSFVPLGFYFLGFKDFIAVIGLVGAVAVGIDSALVIASHQRMSSGVDKKAPPFSFLWRAALYVLILTGVVYELFFS